VSSESKSMFKNMKTNNSQANLIKYKINSSLEGQTRVNKFYNCMGFSNRIFVLENKT